MAPMAISHSHSQPLLCHHTDGNDRDLPGAQGASSGRCPRSPGARRMHSCSSEDMLLGSTDEDDTYFKRCQTAPGYVSFEDVIDSEAFRREGGARPPSEAGITDPLVRAASRLYSRSYPCHQRRSPGPLGTRRGGAMHRFVKKYVSPCLCFIASVFCMPDVAAAT